MKKQLVYYGTAIVAIHAIISALHGWAHVQLGIALSLFQIIFIAVVITLAPVVAAVLLWTERRGTGAWLLLLSMAGSLLFGLYYHYVAISPDHIAHLPDGESQGLFRWTATLLVASELVGCGIGEWARRVAHRPENSFI